MSHTESLQAFGNVVEQLLRDVQERLVFRANVYFKTDILQFNPSPGDLAYPEKLEMMKVKLEFMFFLSVCDYYEFFWNQK